MNANSIHGNAKQSSLKTFDVSTKTFRPQLRERASYAPLLSTKHPNASMGQLSETKCFPKEESAIII
ncbi:MAG: hypothetical protein ACRC13_14755 [Tannerellaceae bacterium]